MAAVAKVVEDVVEFMAEGLACIGTAAEFTSTGYSYEVVPGAVSLNMGLSSGSGQSLDKLVRGHPPVAFISVDFGFAVGITAKLTWSGVGLGGGVGCNVDGCSAYITVAAVGSVNLPMVTAACPFGATLGSATCAQAFGGGISDLVLQHEPSDRQQRLSLTCPVHCERAAKWMSARSREPVDAVVFITFGSCRMYPALG